MRTEKARCVTYEQRDMLAFIGLNRPDKRNAINDELIDEIEIAVRRASSEAKVGILFGHGDHFSAGLDLVEFSSKTPFQSLTGSRRWHAVFDQIQRGAIPFVSALHGAVVGGGLELAASTHVRIADETSFFALPEGQRGIFVGGGGSVRLARMMTAARMTDLILTGRVLDVVEAERFGVVNYTVAPGKALEKAIQLSRAIANNAPMSNFSIINALPRIQDMAQDDGMFVESLLSALTQSAPEAIERLEMFVKKRAARLSIPPQVS